MPREDSLQGEEYEYPEDAPLDPSGSTPSRPTARSSRSHYHLPPGEQLRGVANRIIFSRYYVLFYFVMMCLSLATVGLSLVATREWFDFVFAFDGLSLVGSIRGDRGMEEGRRRDVARP